MQEIGSIGKKTSVFGAPQSAVLYLEGTLLRPPDQGQCDQEFVMFCEGENAVSH